MTRKDFERATHYMQAETLINQFGSDKFTADQMSFLTKTHKGKKAFINVLEILEERGVINYENIMLSIVKPNMSYHGQCITQEHEGSFYHRIQLNSRNIGVLLHELAHVVCFDTGVYTDFDSLCDETAHGKDFDEVMEMIMTIVFEAYKLTN